MTDPTTTTPTPPASSEPSPTERAEELVSRVVFAVVHRENYGNDLIRQRCDDLVAYVTGLAEQRAATAPPPTPGPVGITDEAVEEFADLLDLYAGYVRYDARNYGDTTQQSIGRRMLIEMFTNRPPAPRPPGERVTPEQVESLDDVLADIEALGWDIAGMSRLGNDTWTIGAWGSQPMKSAHGPTRLAAAIALREAIREAAAATSAGAAPGEGETR